MAKGSLNQNQSDLFNEFYLACENGETNKVADLLLTSSESIGLNKIVEVVPLFFKYS